GAHPVWMGFFYAVNTVNNAENKSE
ncbi:MAG: hypothetical protein JWQ30_2436, partial [Sediminibacterium sp.]|nr:hypothetical protein [Sediminibacterium sp.]